MKSGLSSVLKVFNPHYLLPLYTGHRKSMSYTDGLLIADAFQVPRSLIQSVLQLFHGEG